jgi:hypothetical protein
MEERIYEKLNDILSRIAALEEGMRLGDYNGRLKLLEKEMALLQGQKTVLTFLVSAAVSLAVGLLVKALA